MRTHHTMISYLKQVKTAVVRCNDKLSNINREGHSSIVGTHNDKLSNE